MSWELAIGEEQSRTDIQRQHKGSNARGISAPGKTTGLKNIMLWWRPEHGEEHGYLDGWTTDGGAFYFTGTGQLGDQQFEHPFSENGRVRDHVENGDHIRLLGYVAKNKVRYVGELRLDPTAPWKWIDGPDSTMQTRRMIQFRFLPLDDVDVPSSERLRLPISHAPEVTALPTTPSEPLVDDVEGLSDHRFRRQLRVRELVAQRTESVLVHDFLNWLEKAHGLEATGLLIPYSVEGRNLRADLFITVPRVLVEAKATSARESIRMAIGQLLDYSRWVSPAPAMMVLTPDPPSGDMRDLLDSLGISYAWRDAAGTFSFSTTATVLAAEG